MRRLIVSVLSRDSRIEIVAEAGDANEARDAVVACSPDVITLDVEMPGMSGIEFLQRLMRRRPTPVIMCSTLTGRGSSMAIEAMALGAVDCVGKPSTGAMNSAFGGLADKVVAAAGAPVEALIGASMPTNTLPRRAFRPNDRIIFIGASTGGVDALARVLSEFPENCPPTVVVQHMPPGFTRKFAMRLSNTCLPEVVEARHGDVLRAGRVLVAPGGERHLEIQGRSRLSCRIVEGPPISGHRPSVDVLFRSAASLGSRAIGLVMTGMGHDGADGLLQMLRAGATTFAQDQTTSVVYGMPRVAGECGAVQRELPLRKIAGHLLELCSRE